MKLQKLRRVISVVSFTAIVDALLRDAANAAFAFVFDPVQAATAIGAAAVTEAPEADSLYVHDLGVNGLSAANIAALDGDGNVIKIAVAASGDKFVATVGATNLASEGYQSAARVNLSGAGELLNLLMGGTLPTLAGTSAVIVDQVNAKVYAIPVAGAAWDAEPNIDENPAAELTEFRRNTQGFFEAR